MTGRLSPGIEPDRKMPRVECSSSHMMLSIAGFHLSSPSRVHRLKYEPRRQLERDIHPRESGGQEKKKRGGYQKWSRSPPLSLLTLSLLICPHHANDLFAALLNLSQVLFLHTFPLLVRCEPLLTCPVFFLGVVCVSEHA